MNLCKKNFKMKFLCTGVGVSMLNLLNLSSWELRINLVKLLTWSEIAAVNYC